MPLDNIESIIEKLEAENKYGKRARMVSKDDIVFDSIVCLNADIQQENIQKKSPKSYCSNKEDGREEIDIVLDVIYALFVTITLKKIWKSRHQCLKFMGALSSRRKKKDGVFFMSYMPL